ncbi:hypothetical protein [Specibacter sp. NPDC078709]|uniref:hypothetical protein n=1 Tax=Specibacter sp. NPDC078709 TaxID=3154364 RepID=UPI003444F448
MPEYLYFPTQYVGPIKTLLLDANVTGHLDSIAQRGSSYPHSTVRARMADLVRRLDEDVLVMPGLGAAESVIRREAEMSKVSNYHRRSENAMRLLVDDRASLRAWLKGEDVLPTVYAPDTVEGSSGVLDKDLRIVRENLIIPSYATLLKSYQLYLEQGDPVDAFKELELFAEELFSRGSRELMLGALLLTGNSTGRQLALSIMKLHNEQDLKTTLDKLWNTSFDLTYSRVARMPSLPELRTRFVQPAVFVTDDRNLGKLLAMIQPAGAMSHSRGGGLTADFVTLGKLVREDLIVEVAKIVSNSGEKAQQDRTDFQLVPRIRRYRSMKYCDDLEKWLADRYSVCSNVAASSS